MIQVRTKLVVITPLALTTLVPTAAAQFGGFSLAQLTEFPGSTSFKRIAVGDVDEDGDNDVVYWDPGPEFQTATIYVNDGSGALSAHSTISISGNGGTFHDMELGDLDSDGDLDLAFNDVQAASNGFRFTLNDGLGNFGPVQSAGGVTSSSSSIELLDLEGDGDLDAVIVPASLARSVRNESGGVFTTLPSFGIAGSQGFTAIDFDNDGDQDIVIHSSAGATYKSFRNNSDPLNITPFTEIGTFGFFGTSRTMELSVADLNGDGFDDVVNGIGNRVAIALGAGNGTFVASSLTTDAFGPVATDDVDGDGDVDIIAWRNESPDKIRAFLNNGDATFAIHDYFITLTRDFSLSVGMSELIDMNGDGKPDVVIVMRDDAVITNTVIAVMFNQTPDAIPGPFSLLAPADGATDLALPETISGWPGTQQPALSWQRPTGFDLTYNAVLATDPALTNIIAQGTDLTDESFPIPPAVLQYGGTYYWGVTAFTQAGSTASMPAAAEFSTISFGCSGDADGNGSVNVNDISYVVFRLGNPCP